MTSFLRIVHSDDSLPKDSILVMTSFLRIVEKVCMPARQRRHSERHLGPSVSPPLSRQATDNAASVLFSVLSSETSGLLLQEI